MSDYRRDRINALRARQARQDKIDKVILVGWSIILLAVVAFWLGVAYIAFHFIAKWW